MSDASIGGKVPPSREKEYKAAKVGFKHAIEAHALITAEIRKAGLVSAENGHLAWLYSLSEASQRRLQRWSDDAIYCLPEKPEDF